MGPLAAAAAVVSAGLTIMGGFQQASAARAAATAQQSEFDYKAAQGQQQAGQALATGQREAIVSGIKADLLQSKSRAAAAASGGTAADPSVETNSALISERGNYDALSQIYTSTERANALQSGAALDTFQGGQAKVAGDVTANADIMRGFSGALGTIAGSKGVDSLYDKYAKGWVDTNIMPN